MKFSAPRVMILLSFGLAVSAVTTTSTTAKTTSTTAKTSSTTVSTATSTAKTTSTTVSTATSTAKTTSIATTLSTSTIPTTTTHIIATVLSTVVGVVTGLPLISGTVGGAVGNVSALLTGSCNLSYQNCSVTVTGEIENMLTDGKNWTGQTTIAAWMQNGHGYGSLSTSGSSAVAVPFSIACNATANVCTGTLAGNVTQCFANGEQIEAWGWITPSGYCSAGQCVGSITLLGDPGYKAKLVRSIKRAFGSLFF